jgi:hypothetical protein
MKTLLTASLLTLSILIVNKPLATPANALTPAEEALNYHNNTLMGTRGNQEQTCEKDILERIDEERMQRLIRNMSEQQQRYIQELESKVSDLESKVRKMQAENAKLQQLQRQYELDAENARRREAIRMSLPESQRSRF